MTRRRNKKGKHLRSLKEAARLSVVFIGTLVGVSSLLLIAAAVGHILATVH